MSAPDSLFVRACKRLPVPTTPVWFMCQAGRYMKEYRDVRKQYSLVEICKKPEVAAEVTITAAEYTSPVSFTHARAPFIRLPGRSRPCAFSSTTSSPNWRTA